MGLLVFVLDVVCVRVGLVAGPEWGGCVGVCLAIGAVVAQGLCAGVFGSVRVQGVKCGGRAATGVFCRCGLVCSWRLVRLASVARR